MMMGLITEKGVSFLVKGYVFTVDQTTSGFKCIDLTNLPRYKLCRLYFLINRNTLTPCIP